MGSFSVQQKLAILEDNLKNENDHKNGDNMKNKGEPKNYIHRYCVTL